MSITPLLVVEFTGLTICLTVLHNVLGYIARIEGLGLPLEIHRATAYHGCLQYAGRLRWFLHLELHQLLIVAVEIGGTTEIWTTIGGIHCAYL